MRKIAVVAVGALLVATLHAANSAARKGHRVASSIGTAAEIETESGSMPVGVLEGSGDVRGNVIVTNFGGEVEVVDVQPVRALTADNFGIVYAGPGSPIRGAARRVGLSTRRFRLAAGESRRVAVTVDMPTSSAPGDYLSGISVASRRVVGDGIVRERTRNVVPVFIRVPGASPGGAKFERAVARRAVSGTTVELQVRNTSRRMLSDARVAVRVRARGRTITTHAGVPGRFAPRSTVRYPILLPRDLAHGARLRVTGAVKHAGGEIEIDRVVRVGSGGGTARHP